MKKVIGKKIICRVWNEEHDDVLAKTEVKYGAPYFNVKIGGRDRKYKVNYNMKGCVKQDGKLFLYDTVFDNTVGALKFHSFSKHEVMDSDEAYQVFENNAVKMYVSKGGIPLIYLAIAMIAVVAMAIAMIATVPSGLQANENVKFLDQQITQLRQQNAILQQELNNRGVP